MAAAAFGKSNIGISSTVGKDFVKADKGKSFSKSPSVSSSFGKKFKKKKNNFGTALSGYTGMK